MNHTAIRRGLWVLLALASALIVPRLVRFWIDDVSVEFLLTSLIVCVVPGTGVVYTISSSIGGGWRRGLFAAIGCTLGVVPHILAATLGLSGLMQTGAVAFEVVRWAGVVYLLFIGISIIREGGALQIEDRDAAAESSGAIVRRGIFLNLLNPKLTLFFFAFLPQFLDRPPNLADPRMMGLGATFMVMTLGVFVVYAATSAAVRNRIMAAPGILKWVRRSLGALVVGFAARLATTDR